MYRIACLLVACTASYASTESVQTDTVQKKPERELIFYAGPGYHLLLQSEYSRHMEDELDIVLHDPNYNGGIIGVMYRTSTNSYWDLDFALYGTRDTKFLLGNRYSFRWTVFSIELLRHHRVANGLTVYLGGAPAWVSDSRKIAGSEIDDSILTWPLFAGLRFMKGSIIADARYRHTTLLYKFPNEGERDFNLGGFFFFLGGQFRIPLNGE